VDKPYLYDDPPSPAIVTAFEYDVLGRLVKTTAPGETTGAVGLVPWCMCVGDYLAALANADRDGAPLPVESETPGPTLWDPTLRAVFDRERRVVRRERLLRQLIGKTGDRRQGARLVIEPPVHTLR
jgi:hypothetical protein